MCTPSAEVDVPDERLRLSGGDPGRRLSSEGVLADDPGGHAALVLNDGGLDGIEEFRAQVVGELQEKSFVDEIALGSVGGTKAASCDVLMLHTDS